MVYEVFQTRSTLDKLWMVLFWFGENLLLGCLVELLTVRDLMLELL